MSNSVKACEGCRRLFMYPGFGSKFCSACRERDEENQHRVKDYLREHGAANMYQISEATGVSEGTIRQYLRDSMLEIPEGSPIYIKCEICGCDIRSGRWCPTCASKLSSNVRCNFVGVGDVPKSRLSGKMRFFGM